MFIFGTIGCFVCNISFPSAFLAACRGSIGAVFLVIYNNLKKTEQCSLSRIQAAKLFIIGACLGLNWVFLFEAYHYTSVATATLCYYFAPLIAFAASAIFLHEKCNAVKIMLILLAVYGEILVSGIFDQTLFEGNRGVIFAFIAAVLYASVIIMGRFVNDVPAVKATAIELFSAAVVLFPYSLLKGEFSQLTFDFKSVIYTLLVCVIHTGVAYSLYFSAIPHVSTSEVALFSYIDPSIAVLLSALVLREPILPDGIIGGLLILLCTFLSEWLDYAPPRYFTGEEQQLIDSKHKLAYYNDVLCLRHPFTKFTSGANVFGILLNSNKGKHKRYYATDTTVKHEYGHILQLKLLGPLKYWRFIAFPSMRGYHKHIPYSDYYNQPWERGADYLGGVERVCHSEQSLEIWFDYLKRIKHDTKIVRK